MAARLLAASCLLTAALAALTACSGAGSSAKGTAGPSAEAASTAAACPQGDRCYDFTDDSEGWPEVSDDQHFAGHDVYLDGSYRVGARQSGSWSMPAPFRLSDLSPDYGVQLDVDATLGQGFPPDAAWGATCWTRDLGNGRVAGFGAYVQPDDLTVGIYDAGTGAFTPLQHRHQTGISGTGQEEPPHLALPAGHHRLRLGGGQDRRSGRVDDGDGHLRPQRAEPGAGRPATGSDCSRPAWVLTCSTTTS